MGLDKKYNDSLFLLSDPFLLMRLAFGVCNGFTSEEGEWKLLLKQV